METKHGKTGKGSRARPCLRGTERPGPWFLPAATLLPRASGSSHHLRTVVPSDPEERGASLIVASGYGTPPVDAAVYGKRN